MKILDLTRVLAGPWCTQALADMGAEIFKIERPGVGDEMRHSPPFLKDADGNRTTDTPSYVSVNRGKQSLTIDFTKEAGRQLVLELAADCDILVENYKVGDLQRYGLDYEAVRAVNPQIVYCSVTGYGQDGPMARYPGYDPVLQAVSGIMSTCGLPEGQPGAGPLRSMIPVVDVMTGMVSLSALLAALYHKQRTGEGQYIDVALLDVAVAATSYLSQTYLLTGQVAPRIGNGSRLFAPSNCYACADGPLLIQIGNDGQWEKLCKALKRDDWLTDPRFATNAARMGHVEDLDREISAVTAQLQRGDLAGRLSERGVPCGPVNTIAEAYEHPQVIHRALRTEVEHPTLGSIPVVRSPFRFSRTPVEHRTSPALGAETASVLARELGLSDARLGELAPGRGDLMHVEQPLIDPETLRRELDRVRIVDCSHDLEKPDAGEIAYREGHIPGAVHAHLDRDLSGSKSGSNGRHPLPSIPTLIAWLERNGIRSDDAVVAYDRSSGMYAARLWWLLRWLGHRDIRVLDGGWQAWVAQGGEASTVAPLPTTSRYDVLPPETPSCVDAAFVMNNIETGDALVVDARGAPRYQGVVEPIDARAGHIPGAVNRPYTENLGADGRFKSSVQLADEWASLLKGREAKDVVAQCGSGVTACHNLLAMRIAGLDEGRLYAGSWSEWSSDPARPIALGPNP